MGDSQEQRLEQAKPLATRESHRAVSIPAPSSCRCTARGCGAQDRSALASGVALSKALSLSEPQLSGL